MKNNKSKFLLALPLLTLISSSEINAEIFKWTDERGVVQFSATPPVQNFSPMTVNDKVSALQKQELCIIPTKKVIGTSTLPVIQTNTVLANNNSKISTPLAKVTTPVKTVSPIASTNTSFFNSLTTNITTYIAQTKARLAALSAAIRKALGGIIPVVVPPIIKPIPEPIVPPVTTPVVIPPIVQPPVIVPPVVAPPIVIQPPVVSPEIPVPPVEEPPIVVPPPSIPTSLLPIVDISKNITPAIGYSQMRIQPSDVTYPPSAGEFRIGCSVSHMSNDDPIVYPNQQGAAHHHTFFGNTSLNYKSDLMNLSSTGNSTCHGGTANRSAYWIPSMIDTSTNSPIVPDDTGFYYKSAGVDGSLIVAPPKGLRMIAGNSKATTAEQAFSHYSCLPGPKSTRQHWPWSKNIPTGKDCEEGDTLVLSVGFPQCWDGKNLDSPNHQDHMAHVSHRTDRLPDFYCPATHPIAIPMVTINVNFKITKPNQTASWRLASDNYSKSLPGGYSTHADWVNGWDETVMAGIIKNCINAKRDGHSHLLCDGRTLY